MQRMRRRNAPTLWSVTGTAPDDRVARNRDQQCSIYGAPLADVVRPIVRALDIPQSRLAEILGISAPMLSQLVTGQRVKVGNPAALHRLEQLATIARDVEAGRATPLELPAMLADVTAMTGDLTRDASGDDDVDAALRRVASPDELREAAATLAATHPALASMLRRAAG